MKIGLFFGSFNPIHIGHLAIANYMLEFSEMNEIWMIVSPHNPLNPDGIKYGFVSFIDLCFE